MQIRKPFSFFKNAKKRFLENDTLRFLFFVEKTPKHRVMESISILLLAPLSIACFVAGLAGFSIWEYSGLLGFFIYYVGLLIVLLELMHCLFDK